MTRLRRVLFWIFLWFIWPGLGTADVAEWDKRMESGALAFQRADYEEAVAQYQALLEEAEQLGEEDARLAAVLHALAGAHLKQYHFWKAKPLYERALRIREQALGKKHPDVAATLHNLALLYRSRNRYHKATNLFERALAIKEETLGPNHPEVAVTLTALAEVYGYLGRKEHAERLNKRSASMEETLYGQDVTEPEARWEAHMRAATTAYESGQYEAAVRQLDLALRVTETLEELAPRHAVTPHNLAMLYQAQGQYALAEPLYERALAIREKALGPDHPDVARTLNQVGELYRTQGQYEKAEAVYERALAIVEEKLGPEHPDVARILNNLALLYKTQGQYAQAESLYKRSLATVEKALGADHPDVITSRENLAALYEATKRKEETTSLKQSSGDGEKQVYGQQVSEQGALWEQRQHDRPATYWPLLTIGLGFAFTVGAVVWYVRRPECVQEDSDDKVALSKVAIMSFVLAALALLSMLLGQSLSYVLPSG